MPSRRLPVRPDQEQLHRQAKELLRAIHSGDANAIADTGTGFGHALISPTNFCDPTSQNRTIPSSCPVAIVFPSALNATAVTHDDCAIRFTNCPVGTSQRIRSSFPLASNCELGLNAQSVSRSERKCRLSIFPSAAQC